MDSTSVVGKLIHIVQLHGWVGIVAFVLLIGTFVDNSNWYKWGWKLGNKLSLMAKLAPILHGLAQASGWLAAGLRGLGDGIDGKNPDPPLGTEIPVEVPASQKVVNNAG
jgi:hypothetical protein